MRNRLFIKIFIVGCFLGSTSTIDTFAAQAPSMPTTLPMIQSAGQPPSSVQPQFVEFENCNKSFKVNSQKLLYLTLSSINANRFCINEIQSKSGYVLFSVGQKQFLASIINIDKQNSMLKITPCSNNYYFPVGIVQNVFKYIELNINMPIEKLNIV